MGLTVTCPSSTSPSFTTPTCMRGSLEVGDAVCSPESGSDFQAGDTTVTCTCTDCNDEVQCEFTVSVEVGELVT